MVAALHASPILNVKSRAFEFCLLTPTLQLEQYTFEEVSSGALTILSAALHQISTEKRLACVDGRLGTAPCSWQEKEIGSAHFLFSKAVVASS